MNDPRVYQGQGEVEILEFPQQYLGGLPEGGSNKVSIDSAYGQLPRPAVIRPPWKVNPKTTSPELERTYLSLHEGNFYGVWEKARRPDTSEFLMLVFAAEGEPKPIMSVSAWAEMFVEGQDVYRRDIVAHAVMNEEFKAAFSIRQKHQLSHRLIHLYIRKFGSRIPPPTMDHIYGSICEEYIRKQWYEGALDLTIIYVDVAINSGRKVDPLSITVKLQRIGEILESLGRFQEAAKLYKETAETQFCDSSDDKEKMYDCAGLAFKRAKEYEEAEDSFVRALHIQSTSSQTWDINEEYPSSLICNILMMYYSWGREDPTANRLATDTEIMEHTLVAILFCAGFKARNGSLSQRLVIDEGPTLKKLIKRNVQTKVRARNLLLKAASSTSVDDFRNVILSCLVDKRVVRSVSKPTGGTPAIDDAREVLGAGASSNLVMCGNEQCDKSGPRYKKYEGYFRHCPCKSVYYCSTDCQTIHWPSHKVVCRWNLDKKKKKSEQKASKSSKK